MCVVKKVAEDLVGHSLTKLYNYEKSKAARLRPARKERVINVEEVRDLCKDRSRCNSVVPANPDGKVLSLCMYVVRARDI